MAGVITVTLEPQDGFLLATAAGTVSLSESLEQCRAMCDAAAERGFGEILFDCSGLDG